MSNLDSLAYKFLLEVWTGHEREGYATLVRRDRWSDTRWTKINTGEKISNREWRITHDLEEATDVYFCPNLFSRKDPKRSSALPSRWLYADLDEVDPREGLIFEPTSWWQTSPGRYAALWRLDRPISLAAHDKLNQKLTYALECDRGGWDYVQWLRAPGSVSLKYEDKIGPYYIDIPDITPLTYDPQEVWRKVRHVKTTKQVALAGDLGPKKVSTNRIPPRLRIALRKHWLEGGSRDRSKWLMGITKDLVKLGRFSDEQILYLLMQSPTFKDKYGGRESVEGERMIKKAHSEIDEEPKHSSVTTPNGKLNGYGKLEIVDFTRFMAREIKLPSWLIDNMWSDEADGFIAGEAKSFKSLIVMDMLASVASGTKFLNYFDVPQQGPCLYIQRENDDGFMQDRWRKIVASKGLGGGYFMDTGELKMPAKLDIGLMSNSPFKLNEPDHLDWLEKKVREMGIKLVVMDPLSWLTSGSDLNSEKDMAPILDRLMEIKHRYRVGMLIVHHYKKQNRNDPMVADPDRVSGTSMFQRWYESALLVEQGDGFGQVKIFPRHRMHAHGAEVQVEFNMGNTGDDFYEPVVTVARDEQAELYEAIRAQIRQQDGITVAQVAKATGERAERIQRFVDKMMDVTVEDTPGKKSNRLHIRK